MAGENGHYPDPPGQPPTPPPDEQAVAAEIDRRIRGVVRQELDAFLTELNARGVFERPAPSPARNLASNPSPGAVPNSPFHPGSSPGTPPAGRANLADVLISLLADPDRIIKLATGALNVWIQAKQAMNPTMSQIDFLNQIQASNPQLLSVYAPSPYGAGFQHVLSQALIMGMKVGVYGDVAKKAADEYLPADWLKGSPGFPAPTANLPAPAYAVSLPGGNPPQSSPAGGSQSVTAKAQSAQVPHRRFSEL